MSELVFSSSIGWFLSTLFVPVLPFSLHFFLSLFIETPSVMRLTAHQWHHDIFDFEINLHTILLTAIKVGKAHSPAFFIDIAHFLHQCVPIKCSSQRINSDKRAQFLRANSILQTKTINRRTIYGIYCIFIANFCYLFRTPSPAAFASTEKFRSDKLKWWQNISDAHAVKAA